MRDQYNREITYLRISVTERCNLRCLYCMPDGVDCNQGIRNNMSVEEVEEIVTAAVSLGIFKIRITGGEPLMHPDIIEICQRVASVKGVEEVALTTNGILLAKKAKALKDAGVTRVNISLDTLQPTRYKSITRKGSYRDVASGIEAAKKVGLLPLKINTVLIGGWNESEIRDFANLTKEEAVDVRFIELMPIGASATFPKESFISGETVLRQLPDLEEISHDGVARMYRLPGGKGKIGIISAVNQHFCKTCNRIRITHDGRIKPCLHSEDEIVIKGLHGEELVAAIRQAIFKKPARHGNFLAGAKSDSTRMMNQIGG